MIRSTSPKRNRTAPRILTAVNFPDATSLSTILTEHASIEATSFFRSSLSTAERSSHCISGSLMFLLRIGQRHGPLILVRKTLGVFTINRIMVTLDAMFLQPYRNFAKRESFFISQEADCIAVFFEQPPVWLFHRLF
jgi:hypothetical protein